MSETKPRAEQVRFISDLTGPHVLDEYIEACERAGIPLYELIDKVFGPTGETNPDFIQFRIKEVSPSTYEFQYRSGTYVDPEANWQSIDEDLFGIAATAAATATTQANTATTQAGIATTQAGIATAQAVIATDKAAEAAASATALAAIDPSGTPAANDVLLWSTGPAKFIRQTIAQLRTAIGVISPALGGTGVANNAAATVTSSGNFAYTRTLTAATNVTFPTTGTLATRDGTETHNNKTFNQPNIVGVTNGSNAAAGSVGEYIEGTLLIGSATSLVTGTPKTVISISLPAGDWDVSGFAGFVTGGSTTTTAIACCTHTADNTFVPTLDPSVFQIQSSFVVNAFNRIPAGPKRYNFTSTTTVFLIVSVNFGASTTTAFGTIRARRIR